METHITQICWLVVSVFLKDVLAGDWSVSVPVQICSKVGSSVILPCSYDFPQSDDGRETVVKSEMWCLEDERCITERYVYHSAGILPEPAYQSRTQYLGTIGSKNCSMRISDLRESDSGSYVFYLITNHRTQKMPPQRGLKLLVSDSPTAISALIRPSPVVLEGGSAHLSCCSPGPNAEVTWVKSSSAEHVGRGAEWTIAATTRNDSGGYYCQVQNQGQVQRSEELLLDVQYRPRNTMFSASPPEQNEGPLVTLTCSSEANPPVLTYAWYRGAACDSAAGGRGNGSVQSSASVVRGGLTLSRINISSDSARFHCCVSRNIHGSQQSPVQQHEPVETGLSRVVHLGIAIAVLLAIIAITVFIIKRRKKSSRNQSYALAPTAAP